MSETLREIIGNAALLLALALVYDLWGGTCRFGVGIRKDLMVGVLLGAIGVGLMLTPATFEPGIIFDTRSVLLCMSGLFFGALPTGVAVAMTAVHRMWTGGVGAPLGVMVILASAGIGLAWRSRRRAVLPVLGWKEFYLMGVVVHVTMLGILSQLPDGAGYRVISRVGFPVLGIYPVATAVLGLLLSSRIRRESDARALADSEARYRSLFENDHTVMMVVDPEAGTVVDANPAASRFYGWTREQLRGMPMDRINTADANVLREAMEEARKTGSHRFRFRHRLSDGSERDVDVSSGSVGLSDRQLLYSIVQDVSERLASEGRIRGMVASLEKSQRALLSLVEDQRLAQREIQAMRELAQSTLDAIEAHICVIDDRGAILAVNRSWIDFTRKNGGDPKLTGVGANYLEVCRPAMEPAGGAVEGIIRSLGDVLEGRRDSFSEEYSCDAPGEKRWFQMRVTRFANLEPRRAVVVHENITERRETLEQLRRSEGRFRTLVETAPEAIFIESEGRFRYVNAAAVRLFGAQTEEDLLGSLVVDRFDPRFHEQVLGQMLRLSVEQQPVPESNETGVRLDGSSIELAVVATPIEYHGHAGGLVFARDVTDRRRAEAEVRRMGEVLEQRVRERTGQLEASNKELEAFSYSVSHDLRAPLRAINGYAQILSEDHGPRLDDDGRRVLGVISSEAIRMGQLIDDLLRFSRVGRQPLAKVQVNMTALVQAVYLELTSRMPGRRIDFQVAPLPDVRADLALLRQVWTNLIDNALKYTSHRADPEIRISANIGHGEAVYRIADNGAGFDMKYSGKLFGVFQRLHGAGEFDGTGVGLALVQRVIHRHGGQIWADAALNRGATFTFTLPLGPGEGGEARGSRTGTGMDPVPAESVPPP